MIAERALVLSCLSALAGAQSYDHEQRLVPLEPGLFGSSVDIDGTTLAIGAPGQDLGGLTSAGTVHLYRREPTCWQFAQQLTRSVPLSFTDFGTSLALAGDTLVVGSAGVSPPYSAEVFTFTGGAFAFETALPPDANSLGFGDDVAIDAETIAVGAPDTFPSGEVYVFVREQGQWTTQARLFAPKSSAPSAYFGSAVAIAGDTLVVGSMLNDTAGLNNSGRALVYQRSGSSWIGAQELLPTVSVAGARFGIDVAIDGDTLAVGASQDRNASNVVTGAVYVYTRPGGTWSLEQKLTPSDGQTFDLFGSALDLEGDRLAVGAPEADVGATGNAGAVYWYERSGTAWTEVGKRTASTPDASAGFGSAVDVEGETLVAGSPGAMTPTFGAAYALDSRPTPCATPYCTAGASASGCRAWLSADGVASASAASGFVLRASAVEGAKDGLFFFGTNGRQANAWGNGTSFQCVAPPVVRTQALTGIGTDGECDGAFAFDLNAHWCPSCAKPAKNPGAGAVVQAQLWYRDPLSTSNQTTSLSDAIELTVEP